MTGACIFLGSGVGLTVLGSVVLASAIRDSNGDNYGGYYNTRYEEKVVAGAVLLVTGVALIGVSVPFFIMSHRYKQKAMALAIKAEKIQVPGIGKPGNQYYPALTLRVNLGHRRQGKMI